MTPGQRRLRDVVLEQTRDLELRAPWHEESVRQTLLIARDAALSDSAIRTDVVTGQPIRGAASPTYVWYQRSVYPNRRVEELVVDAPVFTGYEPRNREAGVGSDPILCGGGDKPTSFYGALAHFARNRAIWSAEAAPTLLAGSQIVDLGAGTHHRTLAALAAGGGRLKIAGTMVIDDVFDAVFYAACATIEQLVPGEIVRGTGLLGYPVDPSDREFMLELAPRLAQRGTIRREQLPVSAGDPSRPRAPNLGELDALAGEVPSRRGKRWRRTRRR